MIIYTNGCSHTAGGSYNSKLYSWPHIIMKSILNSKPYINNPNKLKQKEKLDILYNDSEHGAGNDFIFHKSLERITELIQTENKPDYVIIQWSGPNRRLHILPDKYTFVNLYDNVELGIKFEPHGSQHTIHYMFSLQEFLKKNKINYLFFNYMALDESIKETNVFKQIDLDKFLKFDMGDNILFNGIIDLLKSKNMCSDNQGHPNHAGNYFICQQIAKEFNIDLIDIKTFYESTIFELYNSKII